ncbi:MAG: hypothetical protein RLZZ50_841, partial [Verrucomicrobiota bacterium]
HLKSLGHVILGDATYGWKENVSLPLRPERVMLHAERLIFLHPVTARQIEVRAPLPEDFRSMIAALTTASAKPASR